jgi:hypothetical protein
MSNINKENSFLTFNLESKGTAGRPLAEQDVERPCTNDKEQSPTTAPVDGVL